MKAADFFDAVAAESWMKRARCAQPRDGQPDDWFPNNPKATVSTQGLRYALALCTRCSVARECFDYAMTRQHTDQRLSGIWGGTTESERRRAVETRQNRGAA